MKITAFLLVLTAFTFTLKAQEKSLPKELKPFVLTGYEILDWAEGDLNGDGRKDAALVLKQTGEDTMDYSAAETASRPLLLITRDATGKLSKALQNDQVILCRACGGVFGDPWEGLSISKGQLLIYFYGGSNWRWSLHYSFAWNAVQKDWLLAQEKNISYHTSDPDKTTTEIIPGSEVLQPRLSRFAGSSGECNSKWKVTAAKTFFYNQPVMGGKPRKGYLLKGNVAECTRELKNFVKVYFSNENGSSTEGYILKKDLIALPAD